MSPVGDRQFERGFTLLELIVVMAIIGLMVALIPGFLLRDNKGLDLDRATRAVAEGLHDVRSAAIKQNRDQLFGLDVERRQFLPGEGATPVQLSSDSLPPGANSLPAPSGKSAFSRTAVPPAGRLNWISVI